MHHCPFVNAVFIILRLHRGFVEDSSLGLKTSGTSGFVLTKGCIMVHPISPGSENGSPEGLRVESFGLGLSFRLHAVGCTYEARACPVLAPMFSPGCKRLYVVVIAALVPCHLQLGPVCRTGSIALPEPMIRQLDIQP